MERDQLPLKTSYLSTLNELREELVRTEKLDEAVATNEEIKALTEFVVGSGLPALPAGSGPRLTKLRKIYEDRLLGVGEKNNGIYHKALENLKSEFARAGDLDSALAIKAELDLLDSGTLNFVKTEVKAVEENPVAEESGEGGASPVSEEHPLPTNAGELGALLINTRWQVGDEVIDFLDEEEMKMPWHPCKWKTVDERRALMLHSGGAWTRDIEFSKDMAKITVTQKWKKAPVWEGVFSERLNENSAPYPEKKK